MKSKQIIVGIWFISLLLISGCSSRRPLVEKLDAPAQPINTTPLHFSSFWEAMENLDFADANRWPIDGEKRLFSDALRSIENGEMESAEGQLRALLIHPADPLVMKHSAKLFTSILFYRSKWAEFLKFAHDLSPGEIEDKSLVEAYDAAPPETYAFPPTPVGLPIVLSRTGSPLIPVTVNGKQKKFWLDTGASVSVLASDVAAECQVLPAGSKEERTQTATTKQIGSRAAVIAELNIAEIHIRNHPAVILRKEDLEFKILGFIRILKVDGIIGWNAIQNMDIELDYGKKRALFRRPVRDVHVERNLFWMGYPIVNCRSENGQLLHFGLDTGASRSSVREAILKKIPVSSVKSEKLKSGSAGGWDTSNAKVLPFLNLYVSGHRLHFEEIATHPAELAAFLKLDGVLGSDIAQNARIRLDCLNGRFTLTK